MKTAPAFQFYASDTMADKRYRSMSLEERGLLLSLYCECWVNRSVPNEAQAIAKWLGFPVEEIRAAFTARVQSFFTESNGELIVPELEKYRSELEGRRARMSEGGKQGAKAKWTRKPDSDEYPNGLPNGVSMGSRVELSRVEKNRGESLIKGVDPIVDPWVNDYEKASRGV